jgi:hypothetical protein
LCELFPMLASPRAEGKGSEMLEDKMKRMLIIVVLLAVVVVPVAADEEETIRVHLVGYQETPLTI